MTSAGRGALKCSLFLLPPALLAVTFHLFGAEWGSALRRTFRPGPVTTTIAENVYVVPDDRWGSVLSHFVEDYVSWVGRHDAQAGPTRLALPAGLKGLRIVTMDPDTWAAFRPQAGTWPRHPGGHFDPANRQITLARAGTPEQALPALARELALALLHAAGPGAAWSPWFAEGMSLYFQNDKPDFGGRKMNLLAEARSGGARPTLDRLLAATLLDFQEPRTCAQAYSLYYYIASSPKFPEWSAEERRPGPADPRAFARIFGGTVEKDWIEFLGK